MKRVVIFDLETTGLDKTKDHIIQFAAMKFEGTKVISELNLKICPEGNFAISPQAYIKHGISAKDLQDKTKLRDVAQQIVVAGFRKKDAVEALEKFQLLRLSVAAKA